MYPAFAYPKRTESTGFPPWCPETTVRTKAESAFYGLRDSLGRVNQPGIIALTKGVIPIVIFSTVSHIILRVVLYCCHQVQRHHAYAYQRLSHPPAAGGRPKEF